mmetsp:Transcript_1172/g.3390  ORF Transcript_1172/g.3390 Transcript_1172/m.3390 type:complete len:238 (+) Transcript_1172:68-781(+)
MDERKEDPAEFWRSEIQGPESRKKWYAKATEYWDAREADLNGILGGFPETDKPDVRDSERFFDALRQASPPLQFGTALDAGAGIGRLAESLLLPRFSHIDLVEPCERFLETARKRLADPRAERFVCSSLQSFEPEAQRYDCIWNQGVLLYLPDDDLLKWLHGCRRALTSSGVVCVKENIVLEGNWLVDWEDNSVARTDAQYKEIFTRAGLRLIHEAKQTNWPKGLLPVKMYALRPAL